MNQSDLYGRLADHQERESEANFAGGMPDSPSSNGQYP